MAPGSIKRCTLGGNSLSRDGKMDTGATNGYTVTDKNRRAATQVASLQATGNTLTILKRSSVGDPLH